MSPAPLVVPVAAGLVIAALLALPAAGSVPAPARAPVSASARVSQGVAVRPAGVVGVPVVAIAPRVSATGPSVRVSAFGWPLSPRPQVLRRFAVGPQRWSPGHRGVDLAGASAQRVVSAGAGTVTFAGVVAGRGVVVVGHAGGLRTTYEPVTAKVRAGDAVAAGAPLGVLAAGSHCPATCLHWGALRGEVYLDPLNLLRPPAPPILLPLGTGR
jgi:murein DD-endopeptidase MepM/ murein hydrolase activator NlpD